MFSNFIKEYVIIIQTALTTLPIVFAWLQLRKIKKNNSISIVLDLEKELRQSARILRTISEEIFENLGKSTFTEDKQLYKKTILMDEFKFTYDILDKIAFCILNKYMSGKDIEEEYRPIVIQAVDKGHPIKEENVNLYKLYHKYKKIQS